MKIKQIIALFCVATLSLSLFCSCGKKDKKKSDTTTTTTKQVTEKTETAEQNVPVVDTTEPTEEAKKNQNVSKSSSKKVSPKKTSSKNSKSTISRKSSSLNSSSSNSSSSDSSSSDSSSSDSSSSDSSSSDSSSSDSSSSDSSSSDSSSSDSSSSDSTKTPPKHIHKYVNGVCSCGKADKSKPYLALATLVEKYGRPVGEGCCAIDVIKGNSDYIIEYDVMKNRLGLLYVENLKATQTTECKSINIYIYPKSDTFFVYYMESAELKNLSRAFLSRSSFTTNTSIDLGCFKGSQLVDSKTNSFTKNTINILMTTLNDFLKSTKSGLTLYDLGFVNYSL